MARLFHLVQSLFGPFPFRHIGGNDMNRHQPAKGIDQSEALATFQLLARVVAHGLMNHRRSRNTLGIDRTCTRGGGMIFEYPHPLHQMVMHPFPGAIITPLVKVVVDGARSWVADTRHQDVEDGIDDWVQVYGAGATCALGSR